MWKLETTLSKEEIAQWVEYYPTLESLTSFINNQQYNEETMEE
jgi:hypothetical protein